MVIDAVIIDAEFKMESAYSEYGHFINLRFIPLGKRIVSTL